MWIWSSAGFTFSHEHYNMLVQRCQLSPLPLSRSLVTPRGVWWTQDFLFESICHQLLLHVQVMCSCLILVSSFLQHTGIYPTAEINASSVLMPSFCFTHCHPDAKTLLHFLFIINVICISFLLLYQSVVMCYYLCYICLMSVCGATFWQITK